MELIAKRSAPRQMGLLRRIFTEVDWIGDSFEELKRYGEDIDMICGYVRSPGQPVEWHRMSHARFDGLAGFVDLLNRMGWNLPGVPEHKRQKKLQFPGRIRAMLAYIRNTHVGPAPWREFDWEAIGPSCGIAWEFFTVEETRRLAALARRSRATLADLLLWTLNDSVSDLVLDADRPRTWVVPVNLRGQLQRPTAQGNQFAFLGVHITPDMTPRELHRRVYGMLRNNLHLGAWQTLRLAGILRGASIYRKLYDDCVTHKKSWMGSVSFLGSWPPGAEPDESNREDMFFGAAVVNRFSPIGAAGICWKGKLGLGLQFHPGLTRDLRTVGRFKDRWVEKLRRYTPASTSGGTQRRTESRSGEV